MSIKVENNTPIPKKPMVLFDSVLSRGTFTFSSEVVGAEAANALEETTFDYWTPTAVPATLTTESAMTEKVDCMAIAAHDIGTTGATVSVEHSADGVIWVEVGSHAPTDDTTIVMVFKPVTAKWWRLVVSGAVASIGVVRMGFRLVFPSGINTGYTPINLARRITVQGGVTVGGQFGGQRITKRGASTTVSVAAMDRSFVDNDMADFHLHYDEGRSFFWAGGPAIFPNDVAYCWRPPTGGEIKPSYVESGVLAEFSMTIEAYVNA